MFYQRLQISTRVEEWNLQTMQLQDFVSTHAGQIQFSTWMLGKILLQFLHPIRFMLTSVIVSSYVKNGKEYKKRLAFSIYFFFLGRQKFCLVTLPWFSLTEFQTISTVLQVASCHLSPSVQYTVDIDKISQLSWDLLLVLLK